MLNELLQKKLQVKTFLNSRPKVDLRTLREQQQERVRIFMSIKPNTQKIPYFEEFRFFPRILNPTTNNLSRVSLYTKIYQPAMVHHSQFYGFRVPALNRWLPSKKKMVVVVCK